MSTTLAEPAAPAHRGPGRAVRARFARPMPTDRFWGWVGPLLVTGLAAGLRFTRLGVPHQLVFDEVYYAHDSYSLLLHGVEMNDKFTGPGFVVHPPLGKWMIAFGEWVFGGQATTIHGKIYPAGSFGWRFSAALVGTLAVLVLARAARRLFRSTLLGCVAGLLLTLDGLEFVQSRTSMLDVFLMFWLIVAFACLVADRDDGLRRTAARIGGSSAYGAWLGVRWWRVGAGLAIGCALATKWDAIWYAAAFVLLALGWDVAARRGAGVPRPWVGTLLRDAPVVLLVLVVLPLVVYVASWTGWFLSDAQHAYNHDRFVQPGQGTLAHAWAVLHGWWDYQHQIYTFHVGLDDGHPYRSGPLGWLWLARPVAYYYETPKGCGAAQCSQEVLGVGTPALWWAATPALLWLAWYWWSRRDWRAGTIVLLFLAGWAPWLAYPSRTKFLFYMIQPLPFMVLAVTMALGLVLGRARASDRRRVLGAGVAGIYLVVVVLNFFWLYPILSAKVVTYQQWHSRMLFTHCGDKNQKQENSPCWI